MGAPRDLRTLWDAIWDMRRATSTRHVAQVVADAARASESIEMAWHIVHVALRAVRIRTRREYHKYDGIVEDLAAFNEGRGPRDEAGRCVFCCHGGGESGVLVPDPHDGDEWPHAVECLWIRAYAPRGKVGT